MKPLFHPSTKQTIDDLVKSPAHAILLCGPVGSGKGFVAHHLASELLGIPPKKLADHPYVQWHHDKQKAVSIDDIRTAQTFMQLRVPGSRAVRRVLIIEQGETMGTEAQNAFLKLLEEPPADSVIIITATGVDQVLPTIRSRTQIVTVLPVSITATQAYFKTKYNEDAITKAYHLSEGYVGLMHALLVGDKSHPLLEQIAVAKQLLSSSLYDRLAQVDQISKQKNTNLFLQAMERVCHAALNGAITSNSPQVKRWANRLKAVVAAQQNANNNVQPKLLLTNLMLEL